MDQILLVVMNSALQFCTVCYVLAKLNSWFSEVFTVLLQSHCSHQHLYIMIYKDVFTVLLPTSAQQMYTAFYIKFAAEIIKSTLNLYLIRFRLQWKQKPTNTIQVFLIKWVHTVLPNSISSITICMLDQAPLINKDGVKGLSLNTFY